MIYIRRRLRACVVYFKNLQSPKSVEKFLADMKNNAICERKIEDIIKIKSMLLSHGMFLSNKVHESRSLRRKKGIQTWNHATLGMEMCSILGGSTGVSIVNCPGSDRWYTSFPFCLQKSARTGKNTEKAEMSQKRSAQQEHGKDGKHKS